MTSKEKALLRAKNEEFMKRIKGCQDSGKGAKTIQGHHVSPAQKAIHKEYSSGDTFEGQAKINKRK